MKYYKRLEDDYIIMVGIDCGGIEITEEEYNEIMNLYKNKPIAEEGYVYRLKEDLTWELCEISSEEV